MASSSDGLAATARAPARPSRRRISDLPRTPPATHATPMSTRFSAARLSRGDPAGRSAERGRRRPAFARDWSARSCAPPWSPPRAGAGSPPRAARGARRRPRPAPWRLCSRALEVSRVAPDRAATADWPARWRASSSTRSASSSIASIAANTSTSSAMRSAVRSTGTVAGPARPGATTSGRNRRRSSWRFSTGSPRAARRRRRTAGPWLTAGPMGRIGRSVRSHGGAKPRIPWPWSFAQGPEGPCGGSRRGSNLAGLPPESGVAESPRYPGTGEEPG